MGLPFSGASILIIPENYEREDCRMPLYLKGQAKKTNFS
jgi:hypothetical protein